MSLCFRWPKGQRSNLARFTSMFVDPQARFLNCLPKLYSLDAYPVRADRQSCLSGTIYDLNSIICILNCIIKPTNTSLTIHVMDRIAEPVKNPGTLANTSLAIKAKGSSYVLHFHPLLVANKLAISVTIWSPNNCFSHSGVSSFGRIQISIPTVTDRGAVLQG